MATHKNIENALKSDLSDQFAEHPIVQWISQNGRTLLWILLTLLALLLLGYRLLGSSRGGAKDYLTAENEMQKFLQNQKADESLASLTNLLKRHPELQLKYDGQIAQELFIRGESAAALPFAERALSRLSLPLYRDYSATTLLIEKKEYKEALQRALNLQAQLNEETALYAANLLRIATLQQVLDQKSEELKSWQQLKQLPFVQQLREGEVPLLDYIAAREKELQS